MDINVAGGFLKFHRRGNQLVAHCLRHGERACRLTRTLTASTARGRKGQGRPLGLALAWLAAADHLDDDTAAGHKTYKPSFEERMEARALFAATDDYREWAELERPMREDEEEEPVNVP